MSAPRPRRARAALAGCGFQLRGTAEPAVRDALHPGRDRRASRSTSSAASRPAPTRAWSTTPKQAEAVLRVQRGVARTRRSSRSPARAACASSSCATASASACTTARAATYVPPSTIQLTRDVTFNDARGARQGSGGAAALPRHADRHGAADHAPPRGGRALKPKALTDAAARRAARRAACQDRSPPLYVIHGDEPLLALEAADAVRAAARSAGLRRARGVRSPSAASTGASSRTPAPAGRSSATSKLVELRAAERQARRRRAPRRSSRYCAAPEPRGRCCWSRCRAWKAAMGEGSPWFARARRRRRGGGGVAGATARALPAWIGAAPRAPEAARARARCSSSSPTASKATSSPRTRRCRSSRCSRPRASSTSSGARGGGRRGALRPLRSPPRRSSPATARATCACSKGCAARAKRRPSCCVARARARCFALRGAAEGEPPERCSASAPVQKPPQRAVRPRRPHTRAALERRSRTPPRIDRAIKGVVARRRRGMSFADPRVKIGRWNRRLT